MSKDNCVGCDKELGVIGDIDEKYNTLILNRGEDYDLLLLDFCSKCGETETLYLPSASDVASSSGEFNGEVLTFNQAYNKPRFY